MRKAFAVLVVNGAALAFVACSKNQPPPAAVSVGVEAGAEAGAFDGAAPLGDGGTLVDAAPGDAAAAADGASPYGAFLPDGGIAPPQLTGEALDLAIDTAVNAQVAKLAPKMTLEGQPSRATLKEGERTNMVVTMQPGRCYTFVAASAPMQVQQLELKLMTPPFYNVEAARSAAADKNPAVIGKGTAPQCPVSPIAVPYRIDAIAAKGGGRVGVYVFSRAK